MTLTSPDGRLPPAITRLHDCNLPVPGRAVPWEALARLPVLHHNARHEFALTRLLARAPLVCLVLMALGAMALATVQPKDSPDQFLWSALLLTAIAAITLHHIWGVARIPPKVPLSRLAAQLRVLLVLTGLAWGSGATLLLPSPGLGLVFAVGPILVLAPVLTDMKSVTAFGLSSFAMAAALSLDGWMAGWVIGVILLAGLVLGPSILQCAIHRRDETIPLH